MKIKIAYSIGIRDLIQFDKDLADKGIDVYMYDHNIENLPYENKNFHWKKIGIGGNSERKYNIQTLDDMLKNNRHKNEKNMILKMDIESAEWNALNDISENILICQCLEVSYIIRKGNIFTEDETIYPVPEFSYGFRPDFNINIFFLLFLNIN